MRIGSERVGIGGLSALTGLAMGAALIGVYGYQHGSHSIGSALGTSGSSGTAIASATPPTTAAPPTSTTTGKSTAASHSSTGTHAAPAHAPAAKVGPPLSSQPYAQFAVQFYPGKLSAAAKYTMSGFTFVIHHHGATMQLVLSATGGGKQSATFASTDHLYFVDQNLGDDSAGTEFNLADDGVVATNAQGRLVS